MCIRDSTLRADSYQDLVNALLLLLGEHSKEGIVRFYSGDDAAAMACLLYTSRCV